MTSETTRRAVLLGASAAAAAAVLPAAASQMIMVVDHAAGPDETVTQWLALTEQKLVLRSGLSMTINDGWIVSDVVKRALEREPNYSCVFIPLREACDDE